MIKQNIVLTVKIAFITLVLFGLGSSINYVLAQDWVPPTVPAPGNQDLIGVPLNTTSNAQIKEGGLIVNAGGAVTSFVAKLGTAVFGFGADPLPPDGDPFYDNSLVTDSIRVDTGQAQAGWFLTSMDNFGTAVWAQIPEPEPYSSCPTTLGAVQPSAIFRVAVTNCRNAGMRLPTAEELACFIDSALPSAQLWTRTPGYSGAGNWHILNLSTGLLDQAQYNLGTYAYRCVE